MNAWRKIEHAIHTINKALGVVCCVAVIVNLLFLVINVFMRYVFKTSFNGATEWAMVILLIAAYTPFGYAYTEGRILSMTSFSDKYGERAKAVLDIVCALLILFVFGLLLKTSWEYFVKAVVTKEVAQSSAIVYKWPGRLGIVVGCVGFCLAAIAKMGNGFIALFAKRKGAEE